MGGIAGWITPARSAPDAGAMLPALEALAHRGASGEGIYTARTESGYEVVLSQPDCDDATGSALILDGTLANGSELRTQLGLRGFVFEDPSSADVLAKAYQQWDKDVVHHLRGAFAFALWDASRERLLLARDRFGEKPLYVCERAGSLYFASEMRALLRMPGIAAQPDPRAVHDYLAYRYVPAPRTLISGVRKLMPGTYALWQFGRLREVRYWFPPDRVASSGLPLTGRVGEPIAAFTEKLDEAVRLRAPGAGVLLSGGVDSAALLALVARHDTPQTFSAGFADDPDSELPRAAALAKHFGAAHHEIVLSPDDVVAALEHCVIQRDAPVSRPSDIALHLIAREAARSVGAVLTGDGSDEVLGGYRRHVAERFGWCFRSMPTLLLLAGPLARRRPELQTAFASLRTSDAQARYARWVGAETQQLLKDQKQPGKTNLPPFDADPRASSLRRALYFDQASWLPDNVLERGDRMTMAESLETRAPFLDHKLVELVSALPDHARVRGLETKWILHQAAKPLLAKLPTRKGGLRVPVAQWLRGELRGYLLEHLQGQGSLTRSYYEPKALDRVIDDHLAGRRNHETALWTLLNLEIWHRNLLRA
jgi:asparagine synthase (glutamine-hydrolysing)